MITSCYKVDKFNNNESNNNAGKIYILLSKQG